MLLYLTLASNFQSDYLVACNVDHFNVFPNNSSLGIIFGYLYLLFTTYELSSIFSLTLGFPRFLVAYMAGRKEPSVYRT